MDRHPDHQARRHGHVGTHRLGTLDFASSGGKEGVRPKEGAIYVALPHAGDRPQLPKGQELRETHGGMRQ